jgi:hypothetical protein
LSLVVGSSFPSSTSADEIIFLATTMTRWSRIFWYCVYLYAMETIPKNPTSSITTGGAIVAPVTISSSASICVAFSVMGKLCHDETHHSWLPVLYQATSAYDRTRLYTTSL